MKKFICVLICAFTFSAVWASKTTAAIAGGVVGYAVGQMSSDTKIVNTTPGYFTTTQEDRHIISCATYNGRNCYSDACARYKDRNQNGQAECSVERFVFDNGYKWIYRRSVLFMSNQQYILLEVSNKSPIQNQAKETK